MSETTGSGPFFLEEREVWRECVPGVPKRGSDYVFDFPDYLSDAEVSELIDLLNKGTHFDHMFAALKAMDDEWRQTVPGSPYASPPQMKMQRAINEAEKANV